METVSLNISWINIRSKTLKSIAETCPQVRLQRFKKMWTRGQHRDQFWQDDRSHRARKNSHRAKEHPPTDRQNIPPISRPGCWRAMRPTPSSMWNGFLSGTQHPVPSTVPHKGTAPTAVPSCYVANSKMSSFTAWRPEVWDVDHWVESKVDGYTFPPLRENISVASGL